MRFCVAFALPVRLRLRKLRSLCGAIFERKRTVVDGRKRTVVDRRKRTVVDGRKRKRIDGCLALLCVDAMLINENVKGTRRALHSLSE